MPVRFQVDSDFYDHPKSVDMSDAATALWVRAGSYSAAKLTDGFVADAILVRLSRTPEEAAQELVRRGLWKRVRGGYRFHQWEDRGNLTRERVEADRKADRERKKAKRRGNEGPSSNRRDATGTGHDYPRSTRTSQLDTQNVRPESELDSERNPDGFQSVSVSVSESVSKDPPTPQRGKNGSRRSSNFDYDADEDFLTFWETYPRKTAKPKAYEAWKAARKRGVFPDVIITAAERYRDSPQRKPDYTANPATWINGERYNDFDEVTSPPPSGAWWDN